MVKMLNDMTTEERETWLKDMQAAFKPLADELHAKNDSFVEQSGDGWHGKLSGYVPVQGEGTIGSRPWYFRARGDGWSLSIAETADDDPVEVRWGKKSGWYYEEDWGSWPDAGWMDYEEAWRLIKKSFQEYRQGKGFFEYTEKE